MYFQEKNNLGGKNGNKYIVLTHTFTVFNKFTNMESAQASGSSKSYGRTLQQKIRDIIGVPLDEIEKKSNRQKNQNNHNFKTVHAQRPRVDLNKKSQFKLMTTKA